MPEGLHPQSNDIKEFLTSDELTGEQTRFEGFPPPSAQGWTGAKTLFCIFCTINIIKL